MTKIKKTYSLDDRLVERLEEAAEAAGLNVSSYLTVIITAALTGQQSPAPIPAASPER